MKKRLIAAALCCLCFVCTAQAVLAAASASTTQDNIQLLRWTNITSIIMSMSYSGGEVEWGGRISCVAGTSSVEATYTLERRDQNGSYSLVDSWDDSGTSRFLNSSDSAAAEKGTFRLTVSVTATKSDTVETASDVLVKTLS